MKPPSRAAYLAVITWLAPMTISLSAASLAAPSSSLSPMAPSATYIKAEEVQAAVRQLSPQFTDDEPVRVVNTGKYNLGVFVVGRPNRTGAAPASAEGETRVTEGLQLDNVTVVLQILDGAGTIVTGGTLADAKRMPPDDPDLPVVGPGNRGKVIRGGRSQIVDRGDTIIIPAGVAHGFSQVKEPLVYSAIRIDPDQTLQLR